MNIRGLFIVQLAVLLFAGCVSAGKNRQAELTVMSYNIRNCTGMDGVSDYGRAAEVIKTLSPDIVALQELDSVTVRMDGDYVLGSLAELTGMHAVYGAAIDFDGGKYGVGILSKARPLSSMNIALPGREEERTLLVVEFEDYIFFNTHLSLTEEDRFASLEIIRSRASASDKPVVLAGDLNDTPHSIFLEALQRDFTVVSDTEKMTFPAGEPHECIDYIMFYRAGGEVGIIENGADQATIASDHCPIWATIRF